jgi:spore coat polysaccharide biosynthesis protein SpsF
MEKIIAVIQARLGSKRFPNKALLTIQDKEILAMCFERVSASICSKIMVATTDKQKDDPIVEFCLKKNISFYRGDEEDVLGRIFNCVKGEKNSIIVRITSDNPLIHKDVIDFVVTRHIKIHNSVTNSYFSKSFPNGTIISVINFDALKYMDKNQFDKETREHLVFGFARLPERFKVENIVAPPKWHRPDIRYCLDYEEDFILLQKLVFNLGFCADKPTTEEIISFIDKTPEIKKINHEYAKNAY